jgi:hypothetical protein
VNAWHSIRAWATAARRNWRLLAAAGLAAAAISIAIELSDRQGRFDIPSGYAVRMTCEPDPESALWSGGCERIAADIGRTEKPSFAELYRAFVTVHHTPIPSSATRRRFAGAACDPGFDIGATLKGTRFVFIPVRARFKDVCRREHALAVMRESDARDRALLAIEREGLSHAALFAGALANLSEPLVILGAALVAGALILL